MLGGAVAIEQTINPDGSFVDVETTSGLAGALYASIKAGNLDKYKAWP
ncbi:MAG: hypothetical protein MUF64_11165 [Polyangiaceae bacterium]|nr:hypothetical protein [Polyangiaceae bacterium]